jgi:hypothetical protein
MGGIVQQINLYRGHAAAASASDGARLMLYAGIGALLIVGVLAIAGEVYLSGLSEERNAVAERLRRQEAELTKFRATLHKPKIDPFLEAELANLRALQRQLDANLTAITQHTAAAPSGFSPFFGGLARNTLDGLWFNAVGLSAGGAEMVLRGQTTEPALIPRLLQTLAAEEAFSGRTFRNVTFERQEESPRAVVDFELRSAQAEEVGDAG